MVHHIQDHGIYLVVVADELLASIMLGFLTMFLLVSVRPRVWGVGDEIRVKIEVKPKLTESNLDQVLLQCLPHLRPEALLSSVDGCGLLVANPLGQAAGIPESIEDVPLADRLEGVPVRSALTSVGLVITELVISHQNS